MTTYDENILRKYADDLYQQAKWIVVWTAVRYGAGVFLVALIFGIVIGSQQKQLAEEAANQGFGLVLFLTVVGIVAGVDAGRRKAFHLKLQAQEILCQRQIEINTRRTLPAVEVR